MHYVFLVVLVEGLRREPGCRPIEALSSMKLTAESLQPVATDLNEHFAFHGAENDGEISFASGPKPFMRSR